MKKVKNSRANKSTHTSKKSETKQLALPTIIQDRIPDIENIVPVASKQPAVIKKVLDPGLRYRQLRYQGRSQFIGAEYDLYEVGRVADTEGFVAQSFDKKTALMFKEGWDIVGKNPKTIKYIKLRLAQIAKASQVPTQELLRYIGGGLIRRSNSFIVKVRKTNASGGKVRIVQNPLTKEKEELEPIAGYFVLPAENMECKLEENQIAIWRQRMADGRWYVEWSPEDIVHFYHDRKEGFIFGTPTLIPVIDDIRALRKIEENIELLIYQHIFPLFVYTVGTPEAPASVTERGEREIDIVKMEIAMMPSEGGIVVPERHKIDILGTEGRALRAEQYLEYFKKRVIAGLGCSEVDFGYGDSSNRSTADTMSQNMKDGVKDFQQIMEYFVTEKMFDELLVESNFGDDVLNDENRVYLKFREIDLDVQVKVANAYADLLNKNMITWDEARREGMGLEPINIPSPEEANSGEDLTVKYPEWFRTHWKLFDEPKVMIQALKVPFSALAEPAARSSSTEINSADLANAASQASAAQAQEANAKEAAKAKHNPKPVKKKDGYIQSAYNQMMQDIVTHIETDRSNNYDWLGQIVRAEMQPAIDRLITEQVMAFRKGYNHIRPVTDLDMATIVGRARLYFNDRANFYINRLTNHVIAAFRRKLPVVDTVEDRVIVTRAIMESFQYRADFINDVELSKAEEMGRAHAFFDGGHTKLYSVSTKSDNRCDKCTGMHKQEITLQDLTLDDIPPYHAGCDCKLTTQQQVLQVEDEVNGQVTSKHASEIKAPLSHSKGPIPYDKGPLHRVPSGQAKYQACTLRAKAKIRTMHPEWDDDKLTELAQQACMHHLEQDRDGGQPHDKEPEKKTGQKPVPRGAVGYGDKDSVEMQDAINMDSCLEKVKAKLRKSHPDWTSQQIAHHSWAICVSANNQEDKGSGEDN